MRRLTAANLLPERAGQPVKTWVHITLADLLLPALDADSALQEQWTEQVRARWAARRAHAAETGATDGAWLDGDAAGAIACDAAMAPIVTGDVNVDALEDLVRLCVELDARRRDGTRDAAWAAIEQAVIGKAVDLLSGPGGLASFLRRRQLGVRLGGPSLPLDIGYAESIPAGIRNAVLLRDRHCQRGRRLHPARRGLRGAPHHAQGRRRHDLRQGLRSAVPVPPPDRDPPVGLDPGREPGRDHQRVEQEQDQGAPQPRTTRPRPGKGPAVRAIDYTTFCRFRRRRIAVPDDHHAWVSGPRCRSGCAWGVLIRRAVALPGPTGGGDGAGCRTFGPGSGQPGSGRH